MILTKHLMVRREMPPSLESAQTPQKDNSSQNKGRPSTSSLCLIFM